MPQLCCHGWPGHQPLCRCCCRIRLTAALALLLLLLALLAESSQQPGILQLPLKHAWQPGHRAAAIKRPEAQQGQQVVHQPAVLPCSQQRPLLCSVRHGAVAAAARASAHYQAQGADELPEAVVGMHNWHHRCHEAAVEKPGLQKYLGQEDEDVGCQGGSAQDCQGGVSAEEAEGEQQAWGYDADDKGEGEVVWEALWDCLVAVRLHPGAWVWGGLLLAVALVQRSEPAAVAGLQVMSECQ